MFQLDAPYVYDGALESSRAVKVTLEEQEKGTLLTMTIDEAWLNAPERQFPVTLDPAVETAPSAGTAVSDVVMQSDHPNTAYTSGDVIRAGAYNPNAGIYSGNYKTRSLLKFNLPSFPEGAKVVSAYMTLCSAAESAVINQNGESIRYRPFSEGSSWYAVRKSIGAYRATQAWTPATGTWNYMGEAYDKTPADFVKYMYNLSSDHQAWTWDITEIVSQWKNGKQNYGILLKEVDETVDVVNKGTSDVWFVSSKSVWPEPLRPMVLIQYLDTKGLEETSSYTQQSMGGAGAGYINNFTGNVTYVHADTTGVGGRMPASISHVYNFNAKGTDIGFGNGFRLNISQQVKQLKTTSTDPLERQMAELGYGWRYTDGDGTDIYFYQSEGKWIDETGKGLLLTSDSTTQQTITDKGGNKLVFGSGLLKELHDTNANVIRIEYSGDKPVKVTDPAGKATTLTYSGGRLFKITEPTGKSAFFTYDTTTGNLLRITRTDGGATQLGYVADWRGALEAVRDSITSSAVKYGYEFGKAVSVSEYSSSTCISNVIEVSAANMGKKLTLDYETARQTVCRSPGIDGIYGNSDDLLAVYQFDRYGKTTTVSTVSADKTAHYGTANSSYTPQAVKTQGSTPTLAQTYQANKVQSSSFVGKNTVNLAENHSFENNSGTAASKWELSDWGNPDSGVSLRYDGAGYQGKSAAKLAVPNKSDDFIGIKSNILFPDGSKTYTLSATVKAEKVTGEGACLIAELKKSNGTLQKVTSEKITGNTLGWQRLSVTFTTPMDVAQVSIYAGLSKASGTLTIDCVQLEEGAAASPYNLVENGGFNHSKGYWIGHELEDTDALTHSEKQEGSAAFAFHGVQGKEKYLKQDIPINTTNENERALIVSGWVKASATCRRDGRQLRIIGLLSGTSGTQWIDPVEFDWDQTDWQFASSAYHIPAGKNYDTLSIYLCYYQDVGTAVYDNIQVLQESHSKYAYDGKGNMAASSPSATQQSSRTYNSDNLLTSQTDPMGNKTQYEYQQNTKNLQNVISPNGVVSDYVYDSFGNLIRTQSGHQLLYYYAFDGSYASTNSWGGSATGHGTSFATGKFGQALSFNGSSYLEMPNIQTPESFTISMWVKPSSTNSGQAFLEKAEKNGDDLLLLGYYNNALHARVGGSTMNVGSRSVSWQHLALTVSKINGTTTEIQLYQDGKLVGSKRCAGLVGDGSNGKRIILGADYDNDGNGTPILTDYFTGLIDELAFFEGILTPQEIEKAGKGIKASDYTAVLSGGASYSADGRFLTGVTDDWGAKTSYAYDETKGLLTSTTSTKGVTASYSYNSYNLPTGVSATADGKTYGSSYVYNSKRQLSKISHNGTNYTMEYTPFGQLSKVKVGSRTLASSTYGANNGLLLSTTDGNGYQVGYTYDALGRVTAQRVKGTEKYQWEYDSFGRNTLHRDLGNSITHRYEYDPSGRLQGFQVNGGGYKLQGAYQYNKNNQVTQTAYAVGSGNSMVSTYNYHKDGQSAGSQLGNSSLYNFYDKLGRLKEIQYQAGSSSPRLESKINYRSMGGGARPHTTNSVDSMEYTKNGSTVAKTYYNYNGSGEVYSYTESYESGVLGQYQSYEFDKLGQLTRENNKVENKTTVYEYDAGGNIQRKKEYAYTTTSTSSLGTPVKTVEYGYTNPEWKDLLTSYDGKTISYDAIGNPTQYRNGKQMKWEGRKLTEISGIAYYGYNADGIRISKLASATTSYYLDGNRMIREVCTDGSFDYYYDGNGQLQKLTYYRRSTGTTGGVDYFPRYNIQGDVTALVDKDGNVVAKYAYDAWGKVLSVTDGSGKAITDQYHVGNRNPIRYRGYYYDIETGFYYLQSRYYDPETGRFLNADGILGANRDLLAYNMFAYCSNRPTSMVDYDGRWAGFIGTTGSAEFIWGISGSTGLVFDGQGSIGWQSSQSGLNVENFYMGASMGASMQFVGGYYWGIDSIQELEDTMTVAGIGIGPITVDVIFSGSKPVGITVSGGPGADFGMHVYSPDTLETSYFIDNRQPQTEQNPTIADTNTSTLFNRGQRYIDEVRHLLHDPHHKFTRINNFSVYQVY